METGKRVGKGKRRHSPAHNIPHRTHGRALKILRSQAWHDMAGPAWPGDRGVGQGPVPGEQVCECCARDSSVRFVVFPCSDTRRDHSGTCAILNPSDPGQNEVTCSNWHRSATIVHHVARSAALRFSHPAHSDSPMITPIMTSEYPGDAPSNQTPRTTRKLLDVRCATTAAPGPNFHRAAIRL